MKILLDENVPAPLTSTVQTLLRRSQRLVTLRAIDPGRDHRYTVCDPAVDPPSLWPTTEDPSDALPEAAS